MPVVATWNLHKNLRPVVQYQSISPGQLILNFKNDVK